jgi:hypothetical protein
MLQKSNICTPNPQSALLCRLNFRTLWWKYNGLMLEHCRAQATGKSLKNAWGVGLQIGFLLTDWTEYGRL